MRFLKHLRLLVATLVAIAPVIVPLALPAQQRADRLTFADYLEWKTVAGPQLSPDATQIIFTRDWIDKKDFDDLMKGVDEVITKGYIDTENLNVYGGSGGGVLTAWIVGHTNRFAAASANCPVTDWISFVGNVKTPTMLMTGVNDLRTPIGQTEEFYEALKVRKIPTQMVRFNDEWHGTSSKSSNFIRTQLYLRDWFKQNVRGSVKAITQE